MLFVTVAFSSLLSRIFYFHHQVGEFSETASLLPASALPLGRRPFPRWQPPHFSPPTDVFPDVFFEMEGFIRACGVAEEGHRRGENPSAKSVVFWLYPLAEFPLSTEAEMREAIDDHCKSAVGKFSKLNVGGEFQRKQAVLVRGEEGRW